MTRWWRIPRIDPTWLQRPRRFFRARDSAIAIIMAVMMVPLIVAAGGAVDLARFYMAKSRLIYALDSAAIAAGTATTCQDPESMFNAFMTANFPTSKPGETYDIATPSIQTTGNSTTVDVSASVRINTLFLRLININTLSTQHASTVTYTQTNLELALVLDNTQSMVTNNLMQPLKDAAGRLLDILFRCASVSTAVNVAIVPYAGTVNIGTGNAAYVTVPGHEYPIDDGSLPPIVDTAWQGCVEARNGVYDRTDDFVAGDANQGEWAPYFWESEDYNDPFGLGVCQNVWWRPVTVPATNPQPYTGHADSVSFYDAAGTNQGSFRDMGSLPLQDTSPSSGVGPNKGCPTPMTPLTNVRSTLDTAIAAMEGWNSGGTIINTGLVWGWRALSESPPFSEGVAYGTPNTIKAIVLITDGVNNITTNACGFINPRYTWTYTAYGLQEDLKLGSASMGPGAAATELDDRLATLCNNIKAQGPGDITIFAITLGNSLTGSVTETRMQNCADPGQYFNAPDGASLDGTFQQIAARLLNLKISN